MQANGTKWGVLTVAVWSGSLSMLGDAYIGITRGVVKIKVWRREGVNPNRPIVAGSIKYMGGFPGRLEQQGQTMRAESIRVDGRGEG